MSELKRLRISQDQTQEELVDALTNLASRMYTEKRIGSVPTFSVRQLSKWERTTPLPPYPHPDTRKVLSAYFERPCEVLGFRRSRGDASAPPVSTSVPPPSPFPTATSPSSVGEITPVEAPPPWMAQATTGPASSSDWQIGQAEVELLRHAADDMDALDQQFGGNKLWRPTQAHLLWVHHMIDRGIYDDALSQQLHAVAGKFTTSLGWFCYDAGLQAQARQYFSEALNAAMLTGDDVLASRTLSNMARQAVDLNKGREAVRFARLAQFHAGEWQAPVRVQALLAIREAQGYARLGDAFNCEAAIKRSWSLWEHGGDDCDPDWTIFLNLAEMTCLEGMCRLDLGQTVRAQKLLAKSETLQDVTHARNRGMCLGRLSVAALSAGDIEQSVAATTEALRLIDGGMSSSRAAKQLKIVHNGLVPYHRSSGIADLLERIRTCVA